MKVFLLLAVCLFIVGAKSVKDFWSSYQAKYDKIYETETEQRLREKIFNDNLNIIEEHNKKYEQGLSSYKLGVNQFTDLTGKEFAAKFKTVLADEKVLQGQQKYNLSDNVTLPESIDWRTKSVVTEVKNQGNCGSCWAFSATGTIESHLAIQTGILKSLSEQQLLDCDTKNRACGGGFVQVAINYVTANGLTLENNYPYRAARQTCQSSKVQEVAAKTTGFISIDENSETQLKQAVGINGPVSVSMNTVPLQHYQEGIFDGDCLNKIIHALLAVGYGIDDKTGVEYWIIKNSWGQGWGEQGYFRLLMGQNLCGVARLPCYPLIST